MKPYMKVLMISLSVFLIATGCSESSSTSTSDQQQEAKLVTTVTAEQQKVVHTSELSGTLQPSEEVVLSFEIGGRVVQMNGEEGARVQKGEVLARLFTKDYALQVEQAEANVNKAYAGLKQVQNGAREQEILQAKASLDKANTMYQKAKEDVEKFEKLYQEQAISQNDYENVKDQLTIAEKNLETAQQAYSLVTEGARTEEVEQVLASYQLAKVAQKQAQSTLDKTALVSPITGTVLTKQVSEGELVGSGVPVYRIAHIETLKVTLPVPDRDISAWNVGDDVTLSLYGEHRKATVTKILPETNRRTGTIGVEVTVDNAERDWYAGQVVKAVHEVMGEERLLVPVEAVLSRGDAPYVFVVREGKAVKTPVSVGNLYNGKIEIHEGLSAGEQVVSQGADHLFDGDPVQEVGGNPS